MKRLELLTVTIVLATAANLWAGDQRPNPSPAGVKTEATRPVTPPQSRSMAQWYIASLDPIVGLSDEQKKAVTEVIESRDKAMREFQSKQADQLSAAGKALGAAYQKNDKEAIAKAQKDYQDLYAPLHQVMKDSQKKLDDVLTPQQKEKQADHQVATWIKALTAPVELSEEQKQKAKAAYRELRKTAGHEPTEQKLPEVIFKVLTPQQRVAINKQRLAPYVKAMFARAKLTDEQNKKVEALLDKICSDPNLSVDGKTYQSVSQKVEELLTKEQKEALKKPFTFSGQAGGQGGVVYTFGEKAPGAPLGNVSQYWIGLSVEPLGAEQRKKLALPADQGLVVQMVAPKSPAAKAGVKTGDVILKAGDRTLKSVQDLVQGIQQAKENALALKIVRDGQKQKISVTPAKRPAEGVFVFQAEGETKGAKSVPGAKVRQLPGGGLELTIEEKTEKAETKNVQTLESARKALEMVLSPAGAGLGERIKRQHELAEKAWQAYQKVQSLGENKKAEAHELWEQIQSLEGQLRETFAPAGGVLFKSVPATPSNGAWIVVPEGQAASGAQTIREIAGTRRQDAAIQELRAQVEKLRRDVDELKAKSKNR
jgi:membrane-associated protease RseP (regulator of RpoE activity)